MKRHVPTQRRNLQLVAGTMSVACALASVYFMKIFIPWIAPQWWRWVIRTGPWWFHCGLAPLAFILPGYWGEHAVRSLGDENEALRRKLEEKTREANQAERLRDMMGEVWREADLALRDGRDLQISLRDIHRMAAGPF
jgi:hypothetical protein